MGDLTKARQEIERSLGEFSTMMLGQILVREGRVKEAMPRLEMIPGGKNFELLRDCWPDSSTLKCAETAKESEANFRSISFTDAWYFGAAMQAFVGKKYAAVRLLRAASEHSLCVTPRWTAIYCSTKSGTRLSLKQYVGLAWNARRSSSPTPESKVSSN